MLPEGFVLMHWFLNFLAIVFSLIPMVLSVGWLTRWMKASDPDVQSLLLPGIVLLATPLVVYTGLFQDYGLATALLLCGFLLVFQEKGPAWDALGGLAFGFAGAVNYMFFLHGAIGVLILLFTRSEEFQTQVRRLFSMVVGGLLPLGMVLAYHTWIWGDPFATPYDHLMFSILRNGKAAATLSFNGLYSSLLGPKLGILFFLPWGILGLAGLVMGAREKTPLGILSRVGLGVTVVGLLFSAYWTPTNSDGAAFNRHLTPLFPFFGVGLLLLLKRTRGHLNLHDGVTGFAAGGLVVSGLYAWVTTWSFPYHPAVFSSPIWEMSFPLFVSGAHVSYFHGNPMETVGVGDVEGNWGVILFSFLMVVAVFSLAIRHHKVPSWRLVRRVLYGLITATLLLGVGFMTDPISNEDRLAVSAKSELQRRALDEKFSVVKESYWIPDGWGWKPSGHLKNPMCHVPWGGDAP